MAYNKLVLTLAIMLLIASAIGPLATEAMTCNEVAEYMGPCVPYLEKGGSPSTNCCKGVIGLNNAANTKAARQDTCNCLKKMDKQFKGIDMDAAKALPAKCKVNIGYPVDPNFNCQSVH